MSRRARALNAVLRAAVKPQLRRMQHPATARRAFEVTARLLLPAPWAAPLRQDPTGLAVAGGPLAGATGAVLWFHGGAYIAGSPMTHRGLAGRLALAAGLPVALPDYRLAPEHPLPAAQEDAWAAWTTLLATGLPRHRILLGGDSAGGGLALSLLARLCAEGTPPAGCIAMSPWTDLTGAGVSLRENAASDALLPAGRFHDLTAFVLGPRQRADDPRHSPLFARFPGCPPVLIQVSDAEILRDDALRMAERLAAWDARVTLQRWPDPPHAWPVFALLPESRQAVTRAAAFARACLLTPPSHALTRADSR